MAWQIYQPYRRKSKATVKLQKTSFGERIIINNALAKELGFNSLTQFASLRYDADRKVIGVRFHQKKFPNTVRLTEVNTNGTKTFVIGAGPFLKSIGVQITKGTTTCDFTREGDILVLSMKS